MSFLLLINKLTAFICIFAKNGYIKKNEENRQSDYKLNFLMTLFQFSFTTRFVKIDVPGSIIEKKVKINVEKQQNICATIIYPKNIESIKEVFLVLHGKRINRLKFLKYLHPKKFIERNTVLMIPDYRGFYDSDGKFSPENSSKDIAACMKYLENKKFGIKTTLIGFSLGTAMALNYLNDLVEHRNLEKRSLSNDEKRTILQNEGIKKVILVAPFYSIEVYCQHFKPKFLRIFLLKISRGIKDYGYRPYEYIKCLHPDDVLIITGNSDWIISWKNSLKLSKENNIKLAVVNAAGHADVFAYDQTVEIMHDFIAK